MITILAALFAVSLSSKDIDEFFTLPTWLLSSVSSANTPGSDPAAGGGWYVQEYTNGLAKAGWKIYNEDDVLVEDYEQPTFVSYYDERYWEFKLPPVRLDPQVDFNSRECAPPTKDGGYDIEYLVWNVRYFNDEEFVDIYVYYADRILTPTNLPSGKYAPRAARLTPELQAGLLSTFAGYFEREYYAMQAQTNAWEQGYRWPQINKRTFRFAPDATVSTNVVTNIVWEAETNFGRFPDAKIEWRRSERHWYLNPFGLQVAERIGIEASHVDSIQPDIISGDGTEMSLTYSGRIVYLSVTNFVATNFTFTATRTDYVTTNEVWNIANEFIYTPTNRVIQSRRLNQYDDTDRLANFLLDWGYYGFINGADYRPSTYSVLMYDSPTNAVTNIVEYTTWHHGHKDSDAPRMFWSSTEDNVFDQSAPMLPTFNWVSDPTANTSLWERCCQTFRCLDYDEVWYPWWYSFDSDVQSVPTKILLDEVNVGCYTNETVECRPFPIQATMRQLIETNFPHADGWAITNDTRRLISDRLCCMNQALSLMDRTYHIPEVFYPHSSTNVYAHEVSPGSFVPITNIVCVATNTHYYNTCSYDGKISPSSITYEYDGDVYVHFDGENISWDECSTTNYTYERDMIHTYDNLFSEVSRTQTRTGLSIDEGISGGDVSGDSVKNICIEIGDGEYWFDVGAYDGITWYDEQDRRISGMAYVDIWKDSSMLGRYSIPVSVGPLGDEFDVSYTYTRDYFYRRMTERPTLGITQPGWRGGPDFSCSKYGAIVGISFQTNSSPFYPQQTLYKSYSDNYSSRSELESDFYNITDEIYDKFYDRYGEDPTDWSSIIYLDNQDVNYVRDSITNRYLQISLKDKGITTHGICMVSGSDATFSNVYSIAWLTGSRWEGWGAGLHHSTHHEYDMADKRQKEREMMWMKAKLGIITRTDWNWKTLKRGDY